MKNLNAASIESSFDAYDLDVAVACVSGNTGVPAEIVRTVLSTRLRQLEAARTDPACCNCLGDWAWELDLLLREVAMPERDVVSVLGAEFIYLCEIGLAHPGDDRLYMSWCSERATPRA